MQSAEIRDDLIETLRMNLVGPWPEGPNQHEVLRHKPSSWYLTGFLVSQNAPEEEKQSPDATEELEEQVASEGGEAGEEEDQPEKTAQGRNYYPSSMGLSFLLGPGAKSVTFTATWGEYRAGSGVTAAGKPQTLWTRKPRVGTWTLPLADIPEGATNWPLTGEPEIHITLVCRVVDLGGAQPEEIPKGSRVYSAFLVNNRLLPGEYGDESTMFQARLTVSSETGLVPRPNLRGHAATDDYDERVADLQYRDVYEFATGHNVSTQVTIDADGRCRSACTTWLPTHEVEKVEHVEITGVTLSMDALADAATFQELENGLRPLVEKYRDFLASQAKSQVLSGHRKETAHLLYHQAERMSRRIESGIALLGQEPVRYAFLQANRAMAMAARQRMGVHENKDPQSIHPKWRPFQLAFVLMNLDGMVNPVHADRETVDLLFFPTGGGKTEAYLGLAAFTLLWRRLSHPGISGAGVSVLMRYTLRLLTLDQLGRAALLICALDLLREKDEARLGTWPFEIGLWVGSAATPNVMGEKGENNPRSARARVNRFQANPEKNPSPIPLESCPWCNVKFGDHSFRLHPNIDHPRDLLLRCANSACPFSHQTKANGEMRGLPIIAVDEPLYRRLPCFVIATVDKFASLPWEGRSGALFGAVQRHDKQGFYGPCDAGGTPLPEGRLPPPDLIIQDELHLISGPLGTVVGLFETVLDELSSQTASGKTVGPKIIASTATVRRALDQIRALFARNAVDIFPPPLPDRRKNFFAIQRSIEESRGRSYLGLAAPGRGPKEMLMRCFVTVLSAAQRAYSGAGPKNDKNPADPYMTLLAYFNSLKELGGCRRIIEDDVHSRTGNYSGRKRENEEWDKLATRNLAKEPLELTSREKTNKVAETRRRLGLAHSHPEHVDLALATNMISVGLDIPRLGLMTVFGQPKTISEYIQATSRVGRDGAKPGLILTMFNVNRPRDRSHYERFDFSHAAFYRSVEPTSVTPFSARSLDRGLIDMWLALARHSVPNLTPPAGVMEVTENKPVLDALIERIIHRVERHSPGKSKEEMNILSEEVRSRLKKVLSDWYQIVEDHRQDGAPMQYRAKELRQGKPLFRAPLDPDLEALPPKEAQFKVHRSMREVEMQVDVIINTIQGRQLPLEGP